VQSYRECNGAHDAKKVKGFLIMGIRE